MRKRRSKQNKPTVALSVAAEAGNPTARFALTAVTPVDKPVRVSRRLVLLIFAGFGTLTIGSCSIFNINIFNININIVLPPQPRHHRVAIEPVAPSAAVALSVAAEAGNPTASFALTAVTPTLG